MPFHQYIVQLRVYMVNLKRAVCASRRPDAFSFSNSSFYSTAFKFTNVNVTEPNCVPRSRTTIAHTTTPPVVRSNCALHILVLSKPSGPVRRPRDFQSNGIQLVLTHISHIVRVVHP